LKLRRSQYTAIAETNFSYQRDFLAFEAFKGFFLNFDLFKRETLK